MLKTVVYSLFSGFFDE